MYLFNLGILPHVPGKSQTGTATVFMILLLERQLFRSWYCHTFSESSDWHTATVLILLGRKFRVTYSATHHRKTKTGIQPLSNNPLGKIITGGLAYINYNLYSLFTSK